MKYALLLCTNGVFAIAASYGTNKQSAIVGFHQRCAALWNEASVQTAMVAVVDENLDVVDDKKEFISHVEPEPEPVEE